MKTYTVDQRKFRGKVVKLEPQWCRNRKISRKICDKTQKALEVAIEQAMNESSEESVLEFLRSYTNNYQSRHVNKINTWYNITTPTNKGNKMIQTSHPNVNLNGIEYLLLSIQSNPGKSQRWHLRRKHMYQHGRPDYYKGGSGCGYFIYMPRLVVVSI